MNAEDLNLFVTIATYTVILNETSLEFAQDLMKVIIAQH